MVSRTLVDKELMHMDKHLSVNTEDKEIFLVSIVDVLNLTLQRKVENESQNILGLGSQGHLAILRS
jgi:hypothetical protein